MRKNQWPVIPFLFLFFLFSCVLEETEDPDPIDQESISAKWVVSGTSDLYESFEFFEDNHYLIVMKQSLKSSEQQVQLIGTYEIVEMRKVRLADFGTISFRFVDGKDAVLEVKPDNGAGVSVDVYKAEKISESGQTKNLCRIWKREPFGNDSFLKGYEVKILFSNAGTYFYSLKDPEDNRMGALNFWKWKDAEESTICYSTTSKVLCDGEDEFEIVELKSNILKVRHPDGLVESYYPDYSLY